MIYYINKFPSSLTFDGTENVKEYLELVTGISDPLRNSLGN